MIKNLKEKLLKDVKLRDFVIKIDEEEWFYGKFVERCMLIFFLCGLIFGFCVGGAAL